jgi:hypothetical protein
MRVYDVGDRVRVTDSYIDGRVHGFEGAVRAVDDDGVYTVKLDLKDSPYAFYSDEIKPVDSQERVVGLLEALGGEPQQTGHWFGQAIDVPPHFRFKEDERNARIEELEAEVRQWRGNHDHQVELKRRMQERYNDLFRAKVLPSLETLRELDSLVRQLDPALQDDMYRCGYDDARDEVLDIITDLSQGL